MKRKICKTKLSKNVIILIDFVETQNYDKWVTLMDLMKDAREKFYLILDFDKTDDDLRNSYIKEIRKADYWMLKDTLYEQQWNYTYFAEMLNHALEIDFNKNRKIYKMKRQISPPLEAFFPKDNFKPTGRDFGLLFE